MSTHKKTVKGERYKFDEFIVYETEDGLVIRSVWLDSLTISPQAGNQIILTKRK